MTCGVAESQTGDWLGLHRHAPAEVYYLVAGAGLMSLDGCEIPVRAGSAVFIPSMAEHGIRQTEARSCASSTCSRWIRSTTWNIIFLERHRVDCRHYEAGLIALRHRLRLLNLPAYAGRDSGPANQSRPGDAPMSSTAMILTSYSAALGRECGACTLCCKVYALPEFAKPPGAWCKHCAPGKGCAIHEAPPEQCRQFFCLWMTDGAMPAEWKPDRARFVLSVYPTNGFIYGQVDPGAPAAWRKAPYFEGLRAMAKALLEQKRHVIMFVGDQATLVMPDETLSLGSMTANDNFRIEPAFGPNGPTWRATKI